MNTGTFEERLTQGKERELHIMSELQRTFWSVTPATDEQDKADKIDCWVRWKGVSYSVAIKWRESGRDLGIAAVRPYVDHATLFAQWINGTVPWDRDAQHYADLYVVGSDDGLVIVTGASVRRVVEVAVSNFAVDLPWKTQGYEIKVVTDKGASGYSSGQKKLIVYIKITALEKVDV